MVTAFIKRFRVPKGQNGALKEKYNLYSQIVKYIKIVKRDETVFAGH